jgi:predicted nucleic acid-binding protein
MRIVLDASVAAKWLLPPPGEPLQQEALKLHRGYIDGEFAILIPDFFWLEIANFLWKAARRGRCTVVEARVALESITQYGFRTVPSMSLLAKAFDIAALHNCAVYDCVYVTLSQESDAPLITADEKLANALGAHYKVRLLSAISSWQWQTHERGRRSLRH